MISILIESVLIDGLDDWVPLYSVDGFAHQGKPPESIAERQYPALQAIRSMVADNLVEVGEVSGDSFSVWDGPESSWFTRIEEAYASGDPDSWGFDVWLNNTPRGDELARKAIDRRNNFSA